jgi:hypothetical protein
MNVAFLIIQAHHFKDVFSATHATQIARIASCAVGQMLGAEGDLHVVLFADQCIFYQRLSADYAFHELLLAGTAYNPLCETSFRGVPCILQPEKGLK